MLFHTPYFQTCSYFNKPYRWSVQIAKWSASSSNTRSGQTELHRYEHVERCQSRAEVTLPVSFSPLTRRGKQTPRYPLSNCPRGQILHWSDMNQAEWAEQPVPDRDWESAAGADRDTEHTAWHADSQSTYRNIRSWQIGPGGREGRGRWWARTGETDSACKIHSVPWAPR